MESVFNAARRIPPSIQCRCAASASTAVSSWVDGLVKDGPTLLETAPSCPLCRALKSVQGCLYIGLEIDRQRDQVTWAGDLTASPFAGASVDAVLCILTLQHVGEDHKAMAGILPALKPGHGQLSAFRFISTSPLSKVRQSLLRGSKKSFRRTGPLALVR